MSSLLEGLQRKDRAIEAAVERATAVMAAKLRNAESERDAAVSAAAHSRDVAAAALKKAEGIANLERGLVEARPMSRDAQGAEDAQQ
jgi:hypothetical protein